MNYRLKQYSGAYFRCVLAEEIGHYFTTTTNVLPEKITNAQTKQEIMAAENQALQWAALYLIPTASLLFALNYGLTEIAQLAKWFNVTEDMLIFRLKLLEEEPR